MNRKEALRLHDKLNQVATVCILSHVHPDGDSLGSLLGLAALIEKNYQCRVDRVLSDSVPARYSFMDTSKAKHYKDYPRKFYDLCILVDSSDPTRLGKAKAYMNRSEFIVNIDHHRSNQGFGQINMVEADCSSTGELIYQIAEELSWTLTDEIASNLYVAIATDTGSFQYSNTSKDTHTAVAELLKFDFPIDFVRERLFQSEPLNKSLLFIALIQTIQFARNGAIGGCSVSLKNLEAFEASYEDLDGVVEFIRNIDTIKISYLIKEVGPNEYRASLRSKPPVRVDEIAHQFEGGGHKYAAGLSFDGDLDEFKSRLLAACEEAICKDS